MVLDTGSDMDLSVQGMYQLQEKYCESVSSRYGFTDTESGMNLSEGGMYQLQESVANLSSRICQLKVCISYRKSVANLSAQGMYQQHRKCEHLSAQGMVMDTGSGMDLSVQSMYEIQEKCCKSVSSRYGQYQLQKV
jgi:hypothetical protein